jgi:hypothetical protein
MAGILSEPETLRAARIEEGRKRLMRYSWSSSARSIAEAVMDLAPRPGGTLDD